MDQMEETGGNDRHTSSSEDEEGTDDGTASQDDEGDRKASAQPSISENVSNGQARSTSQSSPGVAVEESVETGSAAGVEMHSTTSEAAAPRVALEPSLQLDEVWRQDLISIDLPAYVKKKATTISFPEKLMLMLIYMERVFVTAGKPLVEAPMAWTADGRAIVIRNKDQLVKHWIPLFFPPAQFKSFSRKLYRWQFRQVNTPAREESQKSRGELVFSNSFFRRDQKELMVYMQSITAAGLRRQKERAKTGSGTTTPKSLRTLPAPGAAAGSGQPQGELELPAVPRLAAPSGLTSLQMHPGYGQVAPLPVLNAPFGLAMPQLQQASLALMQLDPRVQQNLILASYMNNLQAQRSIPALLPSPVFPLSLLGSQLSQVAAPPLPQTQQQRAVEAEEQKQSGVGNVDEQERIRRAAQILLRGVLRPPDDGSGSGGGQGRRGPS